MKTILVVDDEQDILNVVEAALDREGFQVARAYNGDMALDLFTKLQNGHKLLLHLFILHLREILIEI